MANEFNNNDGQESVEEFSPYRLLTDFTKPRITSCIVIAVVIHVVVIGATSYSYFLGKEEEKKETVVKKDRTPTSQPASAPAKTASGNGNRKPENGTSPIEKKITDKAKPGELPKGPGDIGIGIDETN